MSISADMMLTRSATAQLTANNELVSQLATSLLVLTADKKANKTFRLAPPQVAGQLLTVCWDEKDQGTLKNTGTIHLSADWTPYQYHTLLLMACAGYWVELSRSANK